MINIFTRSIFTSWIIYLYFPEEIVSRFVRPFKASILKFYVFNQLTRSSLDFRLGSHCFII
jgi:hypothetical protein